MLKIVVADVNISSVIACLNVVSLWLINIRGKLSVEALDKAMQVKAQSKFTRHPRTQTCSNAVIISALCIRQMPHDSGNNKNFDFTNPAHGVSSNFGVSSAACAVLQLATKTLPSESTVYLRAEVNAAPCRTQHRVASVALLHGK
jgi:hypothetical protein